LPYECGFITDAERPMNCSKTFFLDLLHLVCCLLSQCPESTPCPIIKSSIWCL